MSVEQCKARVTPKETFGSFHQYRCTKKATQDGWCTVHHPDAQKARDEKSSERYRAKWAQVEKEARLSRAAGDLLEALEVLCNSIETSETTWRDSMMHKQARDAIAKARGK